MFSRRSVSGFAIALVGAFLLFSGAAHAQQAILQGGTWVVGHVPAYIGSASGTPVVGDSGLAPATPAITGTLTVGDCIKAASTTQVNDAGAPCGTGIVTTGVGGALAYYPTSTASVSGAPQAFVSAGALTLGTPASAQGSLLLSGSGGGVVTLTTNAAAGTFNFVLPTTAGGAGVPLLSGGGGTSPMTWATRSGNTTSYATTTGALTSGNCVQFDASGNLAAAGQSCAAGGSGTVNAGTSGQMTYYASSTTAVSGNANANISGAQLSLGVTASATGKLKLLGTISGTVTVAPQNAAGTYEFDLPTTAGTANQPLLSQGGAGTAMTWGGISGNTSTLVTTTGSLTTNHCVNIDASGNFVDSGSACSAGGSGTVNSGTSGQLPYYASSTNAVTSNANISISNGALTLGQAGSVKGSLLLSGSGSGLVTIIPQSAAGTFEFDLPATAGTTGQILTSAGGAGSPMTWSSRSGNTTTFGTVTGALTNGHCIAADASGNLIDNGTTCGSGGAGTVTSGTAGQMAYYPSSTNSVAGNANATISTGVLTLGVSTSAKGAVVLSGPTSGAVTVQPQSIAGTYNFNLPITAGSAGQVLTSQGGGATAMTWTAVAGSITWTDAAQTVSFSAAANTAYCIDTLTTGAVTATLPTTPAAGTQERFLDCKHNFSVTNFTVAPGGSDAIMGVAASMVDKTTNGNITLIYDATLAEWEIY